jgi:HEPN domain
LLQEWGLVIPKIHELDTLLTLLLPLDHTIGMVRRGLRGLSRYAVDYRYPGFHANARKVKSALRLAERCASKYEPAWAFGRSLEIHDPRRLGLRFLRRRRQ